jgi:hypothetical protein
MNAPREGLHSIVQMGRDDDDGDGLKKKCQNKNPKLKKMLPLLFVSESPTTLQDVPVCVYCNHDLFPAHHMPSAFPPLMACK